MRRILFLIFLLPFAPAFAPAPASACSLSLGPYGFGFGLPGLSAGPAAVFTADHQGATVSGEAGEVAATSVSFFVSGSRLSCRRGGDVALGRLRGVPFVDGVRTICLRPSAETRLQMQVLEGWV